MCTIYVCLALCLSPNSPMLMDGFKPYLKWLSSRPMHFKFIGFNPRHASFDLHLSGQPSPNSFHTIGWIPIQLGMQNRQVNVNMGQELELTALPWFHLSSRLVIFPSPNSSTTQLTWRVDMSGTSICVSASNWIKSSSLLCPGALLKPLFELISFWMNDNQTQCVWLFELPPFIPGIMVCTDTLVSRYDRKTMN